MSSLQTRLWLTYALVVGVVLCVVALGLGIYLLRNPLIDRQTYLDLDRMAGNVFNRPELMEALQQHSLEAVNRLDELTSVRVLVLSGDGRLIADSRAQSAAAFGTFIRRSLAQGRGVVRDRSGAAWLHVTRNLPDGKFLLFAAPRAGGRNLLTSQRLGEVFRDDLLPPLARAGGIALLVALASAYWIARWVAAPLKRIAAATRHIAEGRYAELALEGPAEVQEVALAYNEMVRRVQASQQSQRDFVANISHELKTPLTSIRGFAQAILDGTADTPQEQLDAAEVIYSESERMQRLVLDLLDLARFDSGTAAMERIPLDVVDLLHSVAERFAPLFKGLDVALIVQLGEPMVVLGDPDRLNQVFNNLVENALKFTPSGGKVWMNVRLVKDHAEISVTDNGPGIPADELGRIFERFYQTDKSRQGGGGKGMGLGLAITREIVLSHAGTITAYNNSPQGSIFVVKLPLHEK